MKKASEVVAPDEPISAGNSHDAVAVNRTDVPASNSDVCRLDLNTARLFGPFD